jgi:hypothetical protein
VYRALEVARERGFRRVKVRSDDNPMRRRLKRDYVTGALGDPNSLHGRTLALARTFDQVVFAYQPRRKNGVAHRLSRAASALALEIGSSPDSCNQALGRRRSGPDIIEP